MARGREEGAVRAKNPWCDRRPEGAGGGALSRLLHGCGVRSSGARGHSAVVGVQLRGHSAVVGANCGIVWGATVVIVVAGNIGLVIGLQRCKRVVVACGSLMEKTHATDAGFRRRVE